jgi:hypothetical protein
MADAEYDYSGGNEAIKIAYQYMSNTGNAVLDSKKYNAVSDNLLSKTIITTSANYVKSAINGNSDGTVPIGDSSTLYGEAIETIDENGARATVTGIGIDPSVDNVDVTLADGAVVTIHGTGNKVALGSDCWLNIDGSSNTIDVQGSTLPSSCGWAQAWWWTGSLPWANWWPSICWLARSPRPSCGWRSYGMTSSRSAFP